MISTAVPPNGKFWYCCAVQPDEEEVGQDRDQTQVERTRQGDPAEDEVKVVGGRLTGPDARHETTVLLHVLRDLGRVERDRDVEVREEDDQQEVRGDVDPVARVGQVVLDPR